MLPPNKTSLEFFPQARIQAQAFTGQQGEKLLNISLKVC
jgi:hypothetical protein